MQIFRLMNLRVLTATSGLLLLAGGATAGLAEENDETEYMVTVPPVQCVIEDPFAEEYAYIVVDWVRNSTGELLPRLEIRATARPDVYYMLEGRVHFAGYDTSWSQGPFFADPLEYFQVDVKIPEDAYKHVAQESYLSDLILRVVTFREDDAADHEFNRQGAPRLKMVYPDGPGQPVLMDRTTAGIMAPTGMFLATGEPSQVPAAE